MDVLAAISLASRIVALAVQVGTDVPVVLGLINKIRAWAEGTAQPTQADFDELAAMEQPYLDMLNNTTNDDGE